ncbi:MAG: alpha/beta fold hydrolase [Ruminococcus sp.]|nr:alpha/beta fold hydrolase [Ruminococcus sp.]
MNFVIIIPAVLIAAAIFFLTAYMIVGRRGNRFLRALAVGVTGLTTVAAAAVVYLNVYYEADEIALDYLQSTENVTVAHTDKGYLFDGSGKDTLLIFYQGGKVDAEAYAPILFKLAERGIDCFIPEMPVRIALLGISKADEVMDDHSGYKEYYIGGHSLGGVSAAKYAADHADKLKGIVLLAAYATEQLDQGLKCLTVRGSEDKVINSDKYTDNRKYLPAGFNEIVLEGGNHCQFGSYGFQTGDGEATLNRAEQWEQTVDAIEELISPAA